MRILNKLVLCILLILSVLVSCKEKTSDIFHEPPVVFNKVQHILCKSDTNQTYELYLPVKYSSGKSLPVIFIFDPHGSGSYALEMFKEAGERFGFILAASNNSKNGAANIDYILQVFTNDILQNYQIDTRRIYAAGFSGGARVALTLALNLNTVKGIILCGAGISGMDVNTIKNKFDIYALAGYGDFNFNEIASMSEQLSGTDLRYIVSNFDGGHAWPPKSSINEAFQWFHLNAIKDGLIHEDKSTIKKLFAGYQSKYDSLVSQDHFLDAEIQCQKTITSFNGLINIGKLRKQLVKLRHTKGYQAEKQQFQQAMQMEDALHQGYLNNLSVPDTSWWKREIDVLNDNIFKEKNRFMRQMYTRVKGFLGIVLYSFTNKNIVANNMAAIPSLLTIYKKIEPENADMYFFSSVYFFRMNNNPKALECLRKAKESGFTDQKRLEELTSGELLEKFNKL